MEEVIVTEESDIGSSESEGEAEDVFSESSHNTESEQSGNDEEDTNEGQHRFYIGKDRKTKWVRETFATHTAVRTRSCSIVSQLPGPVGEARSAKAPEECFFLFCDERIIAEVVECTNTYIENIRQKFSRVRDAKLTNSGEIKAFIGLLLLAGVYKYKNLKKFWRRDGLGLEVFWATMSLSRFQFLYRCLRFDNIATRSSRRMIDNLAPIRTLFESFVKNFEKHYVLGQNTTIDEQLVGSKARFPFKQYLPKKPAKYGVKIFALCDARTWYTSTLEVYAGKQPTGPHKVSYSPQDVVLRLIKNIENTGRNITMDNWFTSIPLAMKLLEKRLTVLGTIRKNKPEIPPSFINIRTREPCSSIFAYKENLTLLSYVPRKNKNVLMISTLHKNGVIDATSGEQRKPEMVTFYNLTKGGVDLVDKMVNNYTTRRKTKRWPLTIFLHLIDVSTLNAFVIFLSNNANEDLKRIDFIEKVALALVKDHLEERSNIVSLPIDIRKICRKIIHVEVEDTYIPTPGPSRSYKGRCSKCPRAKDVKTTASCFKCNKFMCTRHMQSVCEDCLSNDHD